MSRKKYTARDRISQKMSRDGLIQRNNATGEDIRVSKREAAYDIRGETPEHIPLSQAGTKSDDKTAAHKKAMRQQSELFREAESDTQYTPPDTDSSLSHAKGQSRAEQSSDSSGTWHQAASRDVSHKRQKRARGRNKKKANNNAALRQNKAVRETETPKITNAPITPRQSAGSSENPRDPPIQTDSALQHGHSPLKFTHNDAATGEHDISGDSPREYELNLRGGESENPSYSRVGNSFDRKKKQKKKSVYRQSKPAILQNEPQYKVAEKVAKNTDVIENEDIALNQRGQDYRPHGGKQKSSTYRHSKPSVLRSETPIPQCAGSEQSETNPNNIKGGDINTSQGERDFNLRGDMPKSKTRKSIAYRKNKPAAIQHEPPKTESSLIHKHESAAVTERTTSSPDTPISKSSVPPSPDNPHSPIKQRSGKVRVQRNAVYQREKPSVFVHEPKTPDTQFDRKDELPPQPKAEKAVDIPQEQSEQPPQPETASVRDNADEEPDAVIDDDSNTSETPSPGDTPSNTPPSQDETPDSRLEHDKRGKLNFSDDEATPVKPDSKQTRKLAKAEEQAELAGDKLQKAKDKLPTKKKLRSERVFDEEKGKAKQRLYFEKEVKTQGEHLKGALPMRPVKAAGNALMLNAHRKIYQVEHENVSVKVAHRAEMLGEAGIRSALRHHKTAPYRKVTKLEKQAAKKTIKLNYQKAVANNPKLSTNMFSRMMQKRKIKKDYAKAARETKRAAQTAKKAGSITAKAVKLLAGLVRRHPIAAAVIVLLALLMFIFMSLFGLGSGLGSGGLTAIVSSSYLAEDEDIETAELSYSEWEADLQFKILNAESDYPGYDEYRYNTGDISHNPYELMAYLTAMYQNFPYDGVSADLQALFNEQYSLSFTPSVETRYADPTDTDDDGDYEPYDWRVMTVTLTAKSFSEVIFSKMTTEQQAHYVLLMQTKGNRQYVGNPFDVGWLSYVTSYYGYRVHPITGEKDLHRGVDIAFPLGTEIKAAHDGTVTFAGVSGGYGNVVIIENDKGIVTKYAHCDTLLVSAGQTVTKGGVIATVGNTGNSTGAHLHFEVMKDGEYLNPAFFADTGSYNLSPVFGIPGAAMGDGSFTALIQEAERHLGKPYVFGANGPNSFDCSSFVCYVLTQSGVKNMPRTTAQGIYNQCVPIPSSERQPGDLVFFHSTYSTPNTVTHVAIYAGDGWIIHAGSPVQYTQIDGNAYWQSHLYSYGRLN